MHSAMSKTDDALNYVLKCVIMLILCLVTGASSFAKRQNSYRNWDLV